MSISYGFRRFVNSQLNRVRRSCLVDHFFTQRGGPIASQLQHDLDF